MPVQIPRRYRMGNLIGKAKYTSIVSPTSKPTLPTDIPSQLSSQEIYVPRKDSGTSRVFVIGGGPSLKGFDFSHLSGVDTIVINNAVFDVPNPKYFVTMDYTWLIKNDIHYNTYPTSKQKKFFSTFRVFVLAFKGERCVETKIGVIDKDFNIEYDLRMFDKVVRISKYGGIGLDFNDFRCGSDSGYSALQLAVVLDYEEIYLLGIDFKVNKVKQNVARGIKLSSETHYFETASRTISDEFEKKLNEFMIPYPNAFREIKEKTNCKVFSCSPISQLNSYIPYIDINQVLP